MAKLYFTGTECDIPKEVNIFLGEKLHHTSLLTTQELVIEIDENNLKRPLTIEVGYSNSIWKKLGGILLFLMSAAGGTNSDEIIQALYIDTLRITHVTDNVYIAYLGSKGLFSMLDASEVEMKRTVKFSDFVFVSCLFFLPIILLLSWLIYVSVIMNVLMIIKVICMSVPVALILYVIYLLSSLYKKTKQ